MYPWRMLACQICVPSYLMSWVKVSSQHYDVNNEQLKFPIQMFLLFIFSLNEWMNEWMKCLFSSLVRYYCNEKQLGDTINRWNVHLSNINKNACENVGVSLGWKALHFPSQPCLESVDLLPNCLNCLNFFQSPRFIVFIRLHFTELSKGGGVLVPWISKNVLGAFFVVLLSF